MALLHLLCKVLKHVTDENKEVRYTFCYNILSSFEDEGRNSKLYFTFHLSESGADPGFVVPEAYTVLGEILWKRI
jgi:hypothetical protein